MEIIPVSGKELGEQSDRLVVPIRGDVGGKEFVNIYVNADHPDYSLLMDAAEQDSGAD